MGNQQTMVGAVERCPAAYPRHCARLAQVDGRPRTGLVPPSVGWKCQLVGTPAEFRGLASLRDEAVDRPGVDKLVRLFVLPRVLRVALGNVNDLDAEATGQMGPFLAIPWLGRGNAGVLGKVEQRLFEKMRDQAGVGAMGNHRGGSACSA